MDSVIIVALVSACVPALASVIVVVIQGNKTEKLNDAKTKWMLDDVKKDITRLESAQNKHNNLIERTYKLERDLATAFVKLDDLRDEVHELQKRNN